MEYGGTYLCTCQTSAAELDHKDFYPYGEAPTKQHATCSVVSTATDALSNKLVLTCVAFYFRGNGHICSLHLRCGEKKKI